MSFKNFRNAETHEILTLPTAISVMRGIGGVVLGVLLAKQAIEPLPAFGVAVGLGATDLEGSLIDTFDWLSDLTGRVGRTARFIRDKLHIVASACGRIADTVGDKAYAAGTLVGSIIGEYLPPATTVPLLAVEAATVCVTWHTAHLMGREPDTPRIGKYGFNARVGAITTGLLAAGTEGRAHDIAQWAMYTGVTAAVALGAASCINIHHQAALPGQNENPAAA